MSRRKKSKGTRDFGRTRGENAKDSRRQKPSKVINTIAILSGIATVITLVLQFRDVIKEFTDQTIHPEKALQVTYKIDFGSEKLIPLREGVDPSQISIDIPLSNADVDYENLLSGFNLRGSDQIESSFIYQDGFSPIPVINIDLENRTIVKDVLTIDGLEVVLSEYSRLTNPDLDAVKIEVGCGGGGGGDYTEFFLGEFYSSDNFSGIISDYSADIVDPSDFVGKSMFLESKCEQSSNGCQQALTIGDEPYRIRLFLDVIEKLPQGLYTLDVTPLFERAGTQYRSETTITLSFIIPDALRIWHGQICASPLVLTPPMLEMNTKTGDLINKLPRLDLQNEKGYLSVIGWDNMGQMIYSINMKTGIIENVMLVNDPSLSYYCHFGCQRTLDGWRYIIDIQNQEAPWNIDIGFLNLKLSTLTNITPNSPLTRELSAALSPSGEKLAYIRLSRSNTYDNGQADVFVYDMNTQLTKQMTFTPDIIETDLGWLNETSIVYTMPQYPFIDHLYGQSQPLINSRIGLGVINIDTGENNFLDNSLPPQNEYSGFVVLKYLPSNQAFLLNDGYLINKDGKFTPIGDRSLGTNILLDTNPITIVNYYGGIVAIYRIDKDEKIATLLDFSNSSINHEIFLGYVIPHGFIIMDKTDQVIYQYSLSGNLIQTWDARFLSNIHTDWGFQAVLVPEQ